MFLTSKIKIIILAIFIAAPAIIFPQEFFLGDRVYKIQNGKWYNYFEGKQCDEIDPYCIIIRLTNREKPRIDDFERLGISDVEYISKRLFGDYYVVSFTKNLDPFIAVNRIHDNSYFDYVEFDAKLKLSSSPNDTFYSSAQWNLKSNRLDMPRAWDITKGDSSIVLAVIDQNVNIEHEDLEDNIWENTAEVQGTSGVDDDENDYEDDYHGWNFERSGPGNNNVSHNPLYHGTEVSGIAVARANNSKGIAGIAGGWGDDPGVQLMVLCYKDSTEDRDIYVSHVVKSIKYAAENGADVINMSFNAIRDYTSITTQIDTAVDIYDCVCVVSSGNSNDPGSGVAFPANHDKTIAVGAVDSQDKWEEHSHYGDDLDVVAPEDVKTTDSNSNDQTYVDFTGTSAAAPHVSGLAALIRSINTDLSPEDVKDIIIENTDTDLYDHTGNPLEYEDGKNDYVGYGRINAYKALKYTIENYGGTIGGDGKTVTFHEDITVKSGKTLTIADGTTVKVKPNKKLTIKGTLSAEDVTFKSTSHQGEWGGLVFDGSSCSSSELYKCTIEEAVVASPLLVPMPHQLLKNVLFRIVTVIL